MFGKKKKQCSTFKNALLVTYFAKMMLKQFNGSPSLFRIMLQTMAQKFVTLFRKAFGCLGRFAHANFEHYLEIGIELCPRSLKIIEEHAIINW